MIHELRILPPLAIARFGSAPTPMDNYDAVVDPDDPLGYRRLEPRETLELDVDSGEITRAFVPQTLSFKEDGRVRPVAPFLEVWALTGDEDLTAGGRLEPLTTALLEAEGAGVGDLSWQVEVANLKIHRRTGEDRDRVVADTDSFSDHVHRPLVGRCRNFLPGKTIGLGHVQFVKPTAAHPEIRLRFTPAPGFVYGSDAQVAPPPPPQLPPRPDDVADVVYDSASGEWDGHRDLGGPDPRAFDKATAPPQIYAGFEDADGLHVSHGYLDDGCDGVVRVTLTIGGRTLQGVGRIGTGPPTYAPDAAPIRSVADELEQALLGAEVDPSETTFGRVEEIVRRGFESIRLMNTASWNVNPNLMRSLTPIMDASLVDVLALEHLHQSLLAALRSGTAPWFADVLREYDQAGDFTPPARRKMPAMMRGADAQLLALTRRQIDLIRTLARGPMFTAREAAPTGAAPLNVTAQLQYRAIGNQPSTLPDSAVSNCFPGLEFDFRNIWRRLFEGIELHEASGFVVSTDEDHEPLQNRFLVRVAGLRTQLQVTRPDGQRGIAFMEWSNALAEVVADHTGSFVECEFSADRNSDQPTQTAQLRVRPLFVQGAAGEGPTALIDEAILRPGELTQSLCSPWQNDYVECACYYWAASRPDFINVEPGAAGSTGEEWLAVTPATYGQLFRDWEGTLRFIVGGRDSG